MKRLAYEYRVDEDGDVQQACRGPFIARSILDPLTSGHSYWFHTVGAAGRDLLRVARAVLAADQLSPRAPRGSKNLDRELFWPRSIAVRLPVEDPDRWQQALPHLLGTLQFLTDDQWAFSFEPLPPVPRQTELLERPEGEDVALFSGGLDSALGVFMAGRSRRPVVAVSAIGNNVRVGSDDRVVAVLQQHGLTVHALRFHYSLARDSKRPPPEESQRFRGFFFLALGAAVAQALRCTQVSVAETGVGAINMPINEACVSAQTTRAVHPGTLLRMEELLVAVLDRPIQFATPFFHLTKGELCAQAGAAAIDLARVAISCDEGNRAKSGPVTHCGFCTSCLFRRVALAASIGCADPTIYRDSTARPTQTYASIAMHDHVLRLADASVNYGALVQLDPYIGEAKRYLMKRGFTADEAERSLADLYRRYATEALAFFRGRQPVASSPLRAPPRKEAHRDLYRRTG